MDLKLLSTVITSGKDSSPPHALGSTSRPSSFPSPLPSSAGDVSSSPSPLTSLPSSTTTALAVAQEARYQLPPFSPYSAEIPWHTGIRAFFSQIFPKYGHYCGPNWSSGRSSGSLFWDKPPIDWLDHCCLCHDIGYDTHDQAKLHKADLELLECLQRMPHLNQRQQHGNSLSHKGNEYSNAALAGFYRNICITGLQTFLLPYRRMLLSGMGAQPRKD